MWKQHNNYLFARRAVDASLTQEHFSLTHRTFSGVVIMNVHKSKGKEFDQVLIWEDRYKPIVHPEVSVSRLQQDRLVIRVAVTRAKYKTKFLAPIQAPCILLGTPALRRSATTQANEKIDYVWYLKNDCSCLQRW